MDKQSEPTPSPPYEDKPIALGIIIKAAAALVIVAAFVHVLVWWYFVGLENAHRKTDPRVSPLQPLKYVPPGPHLEARTPSIPAQSQEPFDPGALAANRAQESNMLDSYAWVDEKTQVIRIPIRVAMKRYVEQAQTQQAQTQP